MKTIEELEKEISELKAELAKKSESWLSVYKDLEIEKQKNDDLRTQMRGIGMLLVSSTEEKKKY